MKRALIVLLTLQAVAVSAAPVSAPLSSHNVVASSEEIEKLEEQLFNRKLGTFAGLLAISASGLTAYWTVTACDAPQGRSAEDCGPAVIFGALGTAALFGIGIGIGVGATVLNSAGWASVSDQLRVARTRPQPVLVPQKGGAVAGFRMHF